MFDEVDQDIDRPIDGGEQVGGVCDVLYPHRPVNIRLLQPESPSSLSRPVQSCVKVDWERVAQVKIGNDQCAVWCF